MGSTQTSNATLISNDTDNGKGTVVQDFWLTEDGDMWLTEDGDPWYIE